MIAIPTVNGALSMHFGHSESFAFVDMDSETGSVRSIDYRTPPPHEPGVLPRWLSEQGADTVIAGGMGRRARALFEQQGIGVVVGARGGSPENLAAQYVAGTLTTGENVCDH